MCRPAETATLILEGAEHVHAYEQIVIDLRKVALSELDTRDLIAELVATAEKLITLPDEVTTSVTNGEGNEIIG